MKKSTAYGVQLVLLGLESQEHIHYAMPLRVMGYDYATYKKQYNNNARQYKKQSAQQDARLDEHEFLSKMKKTDRLLPVVTIVIYYGEKVWDAATSLHGILDIPAEMAPYVNDYRMLLVEARQNNLYFHNGNNQDLFNLFEILLDQNNSIRDKKEKAIEYTKEHEETAKEGEARGEARGKAEGIIDTCYDLGLPEEDILQRLQVKLDISLQAAQEYIRVFGKSTV